jgi:murein DD-endopeptidase MepM/ murein hydrolase activator NlpD
MLAAILLSLFLAPITGDAALDAELALLYARPRPVVVVVAPQAPRAAVQATEVAPVAEPVAPTQFARPVPGSVSGFTFGDSRAWWYFHAGVDLYCAIGDPIRAVAAGTVVARGFVDGGYGNCVTVAHGGGWRSVYCHLQRYGAGGRVAQGAIIGYCGVTGWSTGPHLHFELWHNDTAVDPLGLLP